MRDLYHNVLSIQVLSPVNSTALKTSASIDLQGYISLTVVFALGLFADVLLGAIYWTLSLQHSDDNSTFIPAATTDCNGETSSYVVNSASLDRTAYSIGYNGAKRYIQAMATPTGSTASGMPIGIVALKGKPAYIPVVTP